MASEKYFNHKQAKEILGLIDHEILDWTRPAKGYFTLHLSGQGRGSKKEYSFKDLYYLKLVKLLKTAQMPPSIIVEIIRFFEAGAFLHSARGKKYNFLSEGFDPSDGKTYSEITLECFVFPKEDEIHAYICFREVSKEHGFSSQKKSIFLGVFGRSQLKNRMLGLEGVENFKLNLERVQGKSALEFKFRLNLINEELREGIGQVLSQ